MASRESEFKTLTEVGTLGRGKSKHRPRNDPALYGGEYPFVQTGDVKNAPFYLTKYTQTYNGKGLAQSKLWPPGTLCITIAANIADTAILAMPACFPDSILGFTPHQQQADVRYAKYCLDAFRGHMEQISKGTTQDNLSMDKLLKLRFWFPAYEVQRRIAALLTTYDDLIANNQRRIALLESMAEEIYREWFARMRFPGAGRNPLLNGVPTGWTSMPLRSLIKHYIGGGWGEERASTTCPDGAFVFRGTDLPAIQGGDWADFVYRFHKTSALSSRTLAAGDFVFEVSGGSTNQLLGRNLMVSAQLLEHLHAPAICASFCKLIRFDQGVIAPLWMKYFLKMYYESGLVGLYQVQSTGISNYQFEAFITRQTVLVPDASLQAQFCKLVEPLNEQRDSLARANLNLKKTRDSLLPRLIAGKLRVDALDIQFPPSMQPPSAEVARPATSGS